jgi:hypothetical protein
LSIAPPLMRSCSFSILKAPLLRVSDGPMEPRCQDLYLEILS